jgi:hypothetical protein
MKCLFCILAVFICFVSAPSSAQNRAAQNVCPSEEGLLDCSPKQDCSKLVAPSGSSEEAYYSTQRSLCEAQVATQQDDCLATNLALKAAAERCRNQGLTPSSGNLWNHNGSVVRLVADGQKRQFIYENPRPGLIPSGVQKGALLFEGTSSGTKYSGTAYTYSKTCGRKDYLVEGIVSDDQRQITLYGDFPIRDVTTCQLKSTRREGLLFSFLGK